MSGECHHYNPQAWFEYNGFNPCFINERIFMVVFNLYYIRIIHVPTILRSTWGITPIRRDLFQRGGQESIQL